MNIMMWSGMRFFHILQRVLSDIWVGATQRKFLRGRMAAFVIFVAAGLLFWASFIFTSSMAAARELHISFAGITLSGLHTIWFILGFIASIIASTIMLFFIYLLVPNVIVSVRAALIGATSAAILLQLSKSLFSFIMLKFDVYGRLYGPLAGFIMFMSWLYLSMTILLLGAELGSRSQEVIRS